MVEYLNLKGTIRLTIDINSLQLQKRRYLMLHNCKQR